VDDLNFTGVAAAPVKLAPIGALLIESGALDAARLEAALEAQRGTGARIGDVLTRRGIVTREAVAAAAARQFGARRVDLGAEPPDPSLLHHDDLGALLHHRMIPWRRIDGRTVYAAADYERALAGLAALRMRPGDVEVALASADEIAEAMTRAHGPALAARAAERAPAAMSARTLTATARSATAAVAGAAGVLFALGGAGMATVLTALATLNAMNAGLRIAALWRAIHPRTDPSPAVAAEAIPIAPRLPQPRVTLLIPLRDEPETVPVLIEALERLDWPRELLDVKLILEAHDARTRTALAESAPPPFCQTLIVPPGGPRTKPRALNYALDFAEGEIVGVYDAEDRPEPDQIRRAVEVLRGSPPEVACVQCRLSYYNPRDTWLTRCFTIEYAMWFDVLLPGFRDLGLPIPLGGTSLFFRRAALEQVGAWDAHNVTEDAELGMRLARAGFRTETCQSTTHEEASSRLGQWLRQRSRWLKGYMTTWLVHMRRPDRLWRDLGPRGFFGFQAIFLGAAVAYLGLPAFWLFWAAAALGHAPTWLTEGSSAAAWGLFAAHAVGWAAMLTAAVLATARRGHRWLWPWIPTMMLYWPLGAAAAYLAVAELIAAPAMWRKTPHGLNKGAGAARASALARRVKRAVETARKAG
jgi:cellulose synthase/poly-beta-1,6-N-acetylglucosamine synthase-like glycosyltransferase